MRGLFLLLLIGYGLNLWGQPSFVVIDEINVIGNKKTKESVILRELAVQVGDTIALDQLAEALTQSEQLLMNTLLFSKVQINYKDWKGTNNHIKLDVTLTESWYIYPIPSFKLADRNFNVWWVEHNGSLARTNIGMDFTHLNTTGRGDRLKMSFQLGYTPRYRLRYTTRTLNQAQTLGLTADFSYAQNREVNYATLDNRQVFFNAEDTYSYYRFRSDLSLSYRPGLLKTHIFRLGFRRA